ncbi:hypothetical protein sch_07885 [Serratia plymuthica]|jgi:hypothetical protein|nr:hypothetical protein sch_07885 [Serratia plymuthica]ANJ97828.1 hypothetical protein ADP73_07725 [Serratia plymuthica]
MCKFYSLQVKEFIGSYPGNKPKQTARHEPNCSDNVFLLIVFFNEKWIITGYLEAECSTQVTEGILLFARMLKTTFVTKKREI